MLTRFWKFIATATCAIAVVMLLPLESEARHNKHWNNHGRNNNWNRCDDRGWRNNRWNNNRAWGNNNRQWRNNSAWYRTNGRFNNARFNGRHNGWYQQQAWRNNGCDNRGLSFAQRLDRWF